MSFMQSEPTTPEMLFAALGERSASKPHYCLKDLLAQCDVNAPMSEEMKAWEGMGTVGNEIF